eukprot:TRINITY_DN26825_c0_g1_i1.p1 TRINITY_DN26825_c0_g1~~TRINITY_DN26825_c0_g1_i1.p1  ORF type:complete len:341 (+),score=88.02 TRINITY_DN26825_c0_g1_i1:93-1115(+)
MDDDPTQCGRCFQARATNPGLKLMISICGHSCCENCVSALFEKVAIQTCPKCSKQLVREDFSNDAEDSSAVENEIRVRERLNRTFNKQREDFPHGAKGLREYNDYLEMVEDIIYDLVYGAKDQKEQAQERIIEYEQKNRKIIDKNRAMLAQEMTELELKMRKEEEEFERRKQLYIQQEQQRLREELERRQEEVRAMEKETSKKRKGSSAPAQPRKRTRRDKDVGDSAMNVQEEDEEVNVVDDGEASSVSTSSTGSSFSYFPSGPSRRTSAAATAAPAGQPKPKKEAEAQRDRDAGRGHESSVMATRRSFAASGHSTAFEKMRAMEAARECLFDHRVRVRG